MFKKRYVRDQPLISNYLSFSSLVKNEELGAEYSISILMCSIVLYFLK